MASILIVDDERDVLAAASQLGALEILERPSSVKECLEVIGRALEGGDESTIDRAEGV